jgi:hypothetical protein
MTDDPIVEEVRQLRDQYAAHFNHDLGAMIEDLRRGTEEARLAGRLVVSLPPRPLEPEKKAG